MRACAQKTGATPRKHSGEIAMAGSRRLRSTRAAAPVLLHTAVTVTKNRYFHHSYRKSHVLAVSMGGPTGMDTSSVDAGPTVGSSIIPENRSRIAGAGNKYPHMFPTSTSGWPIVLHAKAQWGGHSLSKQQGSHALKGLALQGAAPSL